MTRCPEYKEGQECKTFNVYGKLGCPMGATDKCMIKTAKDCPKCGGENTVDIRYSVSKCADECWVKRVCKTCGWHDEKEVG